MNIRESLRQLKKAGKPLVGCFPLYPPLELLDAMGLVPVVMWGLSEHFPETPESDRHLQSYTCSVARRLTEFALTEGADLLDGLFMYNACDTLRNLPEILEMEDRFPVHRLHIPMAPQEQTDTGDYIGAAVSGLIHDLEIAFNTVFSPAAFRRSTERYAKARMLCRQLEKAVAGGRLAFADFARTVHLGWWVPVADHIAELESVLASISPTSDGPGQPPGVFLSGILPPPRQVGAAIEQAGLRVVGNDIASLARSYLQTPAPDDDPGPYYRKFYVEHYPCPTLLYTGDRRVNTLLDRIRASSASAVIFIGEKFCEYEYFEFPFLEKKLGEIGVQSLRIEIAQADETVSALTTRIEAFAEMMTA